MVLSLLTALVGCAPAAVRRGRRAMDARDYDAAVIAFEEAAQESPEDPTRWRDLARAELMNDDTAGARRAFARMAALLPHDPHPLVEIGFTHELDRNYERALQSYTRATQAAPESAYAYRVLGTRLLRWGRAEDAVPPLERSLQLDLHAETRKALALALYAAGEREAAVAAYQTGLETFPAHLGLRLGLAAMLINLHRFEEALALYDGVVRDVPGFAAAHAGRGILLHELERFDEAEAAFRRAAEVANGDGDYDERLESYLALRAGDGSTTPAE